MKVTTLSHVGKLVCSKKCQFSAYFTKLDSKYFCYFCKPHYLGLVIFTEMLFEIENEHSNKKKGDEHVRTCSKGESRIERTGTIYSINHQLHQNQSKFQQQNINLLKLIF